jgi:hypothetical protein
MAKLEMMPPADILNTVKLAQRNRGIKVMSPNVTVEWAALVLCTR